MNTVIGILIAILVFGVMIFLHESGHYIAARLCKVKVLEFAVGMGPKIFSRTSKKTGIVYSVRALPIGGFTAMQGEDGEDEDPHALVNRPRWQRFVVLFAGSFMNLLTGMIAMLVYICITMPGSNVVAAFTDNNLSSQYGLMVGDEIVEMNGSKMLEDYDILNTVFFDGKEPMDITVLRNGEKVELKGVQFPVQEIEGTTGGVVDFRLYAAEKNLGSILSQTVKKSFSTVLWVYKTLAKLIAGKIGMNAVSGPVGTVSAVSQVVQYGFPELLYFFVVISINLGIMNLLPLPALDGGRIVFLLIETIIRRPLNPKAETYIHLAGMILLLGFMAVITVFDVLKLIR